MPKKIKCPICKKEIVWEGNVFRPFCSERCRTRDLGNWASGRYAVPVEEFQSSLSENSSDESGEGNE